VIAVPLFLWLVAGWVAFRFLLFLDDRLVSQRSPGFQLLVGMGALAYGVPVLLECRWWAVPIVALGIRSASMLVDFAWPLRWLRRFFAARRHAALPDNVFPLRSH
jgi:hypothetical protein